MMPVKQAVEIAANHLQLLLPEAENVLLEEVELSEDDQYWLVTLGFTHPNYKPALAQVALAKPPRKYKVFRINGTTGEIRSMKIREPMNV